MTGHRTVEADRLLGSRDQGCFGMVGRLVTMSTALWQNTGNRWAHLEATGFDDEKALHDLVADAPELIPLSGSPDVVVVGREVPVGSGYIDLFAVEGSGRPVIIEVKLAKNAEARRAVVSQGLSYAAHLFSLTAEELEQGPLARALAGQHGSLLAAARAADQDGAYTDADRSETLAECLASGSFRLVLILDSAPAELVRLVGYLESITRDRLMIDLVTVAAYDVGETKILVPQRVEPDRQLDDAAGPVAPRRAVKQGVWWEGSDAFRRSVDDDNPSVANRAELERLCAWAEMIHSRGYAALGTWRGTSGRHTLLLRFRPSGRARHGLAVVYNERGRPSLQLNRGVFEKRAPETMATIEDLIAPAKLGLGSVVPADRVTDKLLDALTDAYRVGAEHVASEE